MAKSNKSCIHQVKIVCLNSGMDEAVAIRLVAV